MHKAIELLGIKEINKKDIIDLNLNLDDSDIDMEQFGFEEFEKEYNESTEEEPFDDIEKLEKHYGVPYQGNKSRIADIIINILPGGKRLVDLFGGGGCYYSLWYVIK